jgi:hypothetical protein
MVDNFSFQQSFIHVGKSYAYPQRVSHLLKAGKILDLSLSAFL